jgi:hypothetical protein
MRRVGEQTSLELTPKAARALAEETFGARLRGWILRAEVKFTDVAHALAIPREHLYEIMDGTRHFKAAWLRLLPPAVAKCAADDLADLINYELRPQAVLSAEHDDDHTAAALVREACETIQRITTTLADRQIDRREAVDLLRELDELEVAMAPVRARLRQVIERGAVVIPPKPYPTRGDCS